jgi:hypothetical protein
MRRQFGLFATGRANNAAVVRGILATRRANNATIGRGAGNGCCKGSSKGGEGNTDLNHTLNAIHVFHSYLNE